MPASSSPFLSRLVWASLGPATGATLALGLLIAGLGLLAQALVTTGVSPGPGLFVQLALASLGSAGAVAWPLAALAGAALGARRLRDEGAWLALQSLGVGPRALTRAALPFALCAGAGSGVVTHLAEPAARAGLRDSRAATVAAVEPREGQTLQLGPWSVAVQDERIYFTDGGRAGEAEGWALRPAAAGVVMELEAGRIEAWDRSTSLSFERLSLPIRLPGTEGRIAPAERGTPDLWRRAHSPYERWILWKRTVLPTLLVPLVLASLRGGVSSWPLGGVVGGGVLGLWGSVRLLDQLAGAIGPALPSALLLIFGLLAAWWAARDAA